MNTVNRRDFLAPAAALTGASWLPFSNSARAESHQKLKESASSATTLFALRRCSLRRSCCGWRDSRSLSTFGRTTKSTQHKHRTDIGFAITVNGGQQ